MGIESVRARLKDRQVKDGARGTDEVTICLDVALVGELADLQSALALSSVPAPSVGKARLGGSAAESEDDSEAAELRKDIEAKETEIRESSLRLVFRSLGSSRYQEILNANPEANDSPEGQADFFNELSAASLHEVWEFAGGKEVKVDGLTWDELRPELSYGEWEQATLKVVALNRRKVDVPFSLRPSKASRS